MTVDQVIALGASIGACMSAIAAFFAVRQSSIHSKASYKPELVIARSRFECESEVSIPYEWKTPDSENKEIDFMKLYSVPLHNVGLGAAKEVSIKWSFPIDQMVSSVNEIAQKSLISAYFEFKNGLLSFKSEKMPENTSIWKNQQNHTVDFVLPSPVNEAPVQLTIPLSFTQLASALVYFSANTRDFNSIPDIPVLKAEMSYLDIGGSKHSCTINLKTNIHMVMNKGKSFSGQIESYKSA